MTRIYLDETGIGPDDQLFVDCEILETRALLEETWPCPAPNWHHDGGCLADYATLWMLRVGVRLHSAHLEVTYECGIQRVLSMEEIAAASVDLTDARFIDPITRPEESHLTDAGGGVLVSDLIGVERIDHAIDRIDQALEENRQGGCDCGGHRPDVHSETATSRVTLNGTGGDPVT